MTEAEIQNAIFLELGRELDVTLWRNNTGQAKAEVVTRAHLERLLSFVASQNRINDACELLRALLSQPTRFTRYGLAKGSSDIIGIVQVPARVWTNGSTGVFLALEVKTPGVPGKRPGVVTAEQQMFLDIVNRRGGVGRVVRSVEDARAAINEARAL